ncbi:prepilin peptidase [Anaerocolumna cellulosilytica]|nr:A24 family peptidase [Anaerocolumna cellulosilytica]MBB5196339.1 leader peptidase (prepilin peptidase)/N-methyltransferase [Anaerocolumna cellulosilytica]
MQANTMLQAVLFFILMVGAAYLDIRKRVIPTVIWCSVGAISCLDFRPIHLMGILAAVPLLIIAVWIAPNRLGGGDIKLVAATGLVLGLQETNMAVILGLSLQIVVFGFVFLLQRVKAKEKGRKDFKDCSMPLAPCLTIGFLCIYSLKLGGVINELI